MSAVGRAPRAPPRRAGLPRQDADEEGQEPRPALEGPRSLEEGEERRLDEVLGLTDRGRESHGERHQLRRDGVEQRPERLDVALLAVALEVLLGRPSCTPHP